MLGDRLVMTIVVLVGRKCSDFCEVLLLLLFTRVDLDYCCYFFPAFEKAGKIYECE